MKQILRPIGYMTLVLLGGVIQIFSTITVKLIGFLDSSDTSMYLLSFLGVLIVGVVVFEISLIANWRSSKSKSSSATILRSTYSRAVESRNNAIQQLRHILADKESEMGVVKHSFSEIESSIKELEKERDGWKEANEIAEGKLIQERQRLEKEHQASLKKANEIAEGKLVQERQSLEKERQASLKEASKITEGKLTQERQRLEKEHQASLKKANEIAEGKLVQERQSLEKERQASLKEASKITEGKLTQERQRLEKEHQASLKEASKIAEGKLTQEHQRLEKEHQASLKKANEIAEGKLTQEHQRLEKEYQDNLKIASENAENELTQERQRLMENISTDITDGESIILVSKKAWKKAGDSNETLQWAGLFSKIKNPSLRSQQENPVGDGWWVYPRSRSSDGRRVMYFREKKEITIIKVCEFFRHDKYEDFRQDGDMKSSKYKELDFSYVPLETAT